MKPPDTLLLLHVSDPTGVVALSQDESVHVRVLPPEQQHAGSVLGAVEDLLQQRNLSMADVGGLVVTRGPGSFTGIRIGLATAQGLSLACDCPVWSTDSLLPLAYATGIASGFVAAVLDAKRQEIYAGLYYVQGHRWDCVRPAFCDSPQGGGQRLAAALAPESPLCLVGSGAGLLVDPLRLASGQAGTLLPAPEPQALARALMSLSREGYCDVSRAMELEPFYLRKSDAEIRKQKERHGF